MPHEERLEILAFDSNDACRLLFGHQNENLKALETALAIAVDSRGGEITLRGANESVGLAITLLNQLYQAAEQGILLRPDDFSRSAQTLKQNPQADLKGVFLDKVIFPNLTGRRNIAPKTVAQKAYVDAIRKNEMVFAVGPAGTGKTYLAMAMAVLGLLRKDYKRLILTRPAVEAGEKLGFLPGDLAEKINPYLRPLYDALYDMVDMERAREWMAQGIVEVAPLAFMRGRTLNDAFIILDEAQNTTPEQMKMFLTRMGFGSKVVVTGDITQIDLPGHVPSGLIQAVRVLEQVSGLAVCRFSQVDVVRHPIVARIVAAYEAQETVSHG